MKTGLIFSPDSKRLAYPVQKGKKWSVVVDGQAGAEFDGTVENSLNFSPDGKRLGFVAVKGGKSLVVVDGQEAGTGYDGTIEGSLKLTDLHVVAYAAKRGDKAFAVVDEKATPAYDGIDDPIFSPDGKRLAYAARTGKKWLVVVDGQPGAEYDGVFALSFRSNDDFEYLAVKKQTFYRVTVSDHPKT
jgi:Tol biopolymer transport system component